MGKNIEKGKRYKSVFDYRKEAIEKKMYLAVVMLDYAMIEDRLTSFLENSGVLTKDEHKPKKAFCETLGIITRENARHIRISDKIAWIKTMLELRETKNSKTLPNTNVNLLIETLQCTDKESLLLTMTKLQTWTDKRNKLVHNLMNGNMSVNSSAIKKMAEDGLICFRAIDREISKLKRYNNHN